MTVSKTILVGFLGRTPEVTFSQGGLAICKFSIATNDYVKKGAQPETSWHSIVAFGKQAEAIGAYVTKGQQLYVEGRIKYGSYENKAGATVKTTDIILSDFQFLEKKAGGQKQSMPEPEQQAFNGGDGNDSSDIPF